MRHLRFLRHYLTVALLLTVSLAYSAPANVKPESTPVGNDAFGYECDEATTAEGIEYIAPLSYTVTFDVNGYGSLTGDPAQVVDEGLSATPVEAVADPGFVFVNWTALGTEFSTDNPLTVTNVTENTAITAVFEVKTYAFTSNSGSGGSILPLGTISVVEGNDQSYSIFAESGFAIANVIVDGVSVGPVSTYTFTNAAETHSISATFDVLERDGNGGCTLSRGSAGSNTLAVLGVVIAMLVCSTRLRRQDA